MPRRPPQTNRQATAPPRRDPPMPSYPRRQEGQVQDVRLLRSTLAQEYRRVENGRSTASAGVARLLAANVRSLPRQGPPRLDIVTFHRIRMGGVITPRVVYNIERCKVPGAIPRLSHDVWECEALAAIGLGRAVIERPPVTCGPRPMEDRSTTREPRSTSSGTQGQAPPQQRGADNLAGISASPDCPEALPRSRFLEAALEARLRVLWLRRQAVASCARRTVVIARRDNVASLGLRMCN
ncbi:hypothetical protein HPB47_020017 [Ixodes persulcatus]|uniref:Uncharacterized protein n=1 Tax=Ixodes persulcatus TaxID=34615 RepID=A0AC60QHI7_IXOPE|nr:hypothetical protein HPB47_020017 [Ixodes persulcatus]